MTGEAVRAADSAVRQVRRIASQLSPASWAVIVGVVLALGYLGWSPLAPDLAAQIARANVVRSAGNVSWWTGWFGGISLPTYSLLTPSSMAIFGVRATGVAAAVVGGVISARLVGAARRPRAGAVAFSVAEMANLLDGRVTFAVGVTLAAGALLAVQVRRPLLAAPLAAVAYFASPLAGLFLGLALVAVLVVDPSRRRIAAALAVLLAMLGASMALLFPGTGEMPFHPTDLIPACLCCIGVALCCPTRVVRAAALLLMLALPVFLVAPGAIGNNVTRMAWICAVPVTVAYSPLRRGLLIILLGLLAVWPTADLVQQLSTTRDPSTTAAFYRPLLAALDHEQAAAGPAAVATVYLADRASLARGWDRQADVANDPIFYRDNALNAATYRGWLHDLAVGWVAVPAVRLDYSAVAESKLVAGGLDYLQLAWSSPSWKLYRVVDSTPLAEGARVVRVEPTRILISATERTSVRLRVRWSPYLAVQHPDGTMVVGACLSDAAGWLDVTLPAAGEYRVTSRFDPVHRLARAPRCQR